MNANPFYDREPLRIHGISDDLGDLHFEVSECCLAHADNRLSGHNGVHLRAKVGVGYYLEAYKSVSALKAWPTKFERLMGVWNARLLAVAALLRHILEDVAVARKLSRQRAGDTSSIPM